MSSKLINSVLLFFILVFYFGILVFFITLKPEDPVVNMDYKDWVLVALTTISVLLTALTIFIGVAAFFTYKGLEDRAAERIEKAADEKNKNNKSFDPPNPQQKKSGDED